MLLASMTSAAESDQPTANTYSVWVGTHYTDFSDYRRKVGEYNLGKDEWRPEFRFDNFSRSGSGTFDLTTHYYDPRNILGRLATTSERFKGIFQYRSLTRQLGQDMLGNLETREWLSTRPGGKILTHELRDSGADYNIRRQELLSKISVLMSQQNNVRFSAAHRMILQDGQAQSVATNHCFSCHVVSQTAKVENTTHELEAGLEGDVGKYRLGYQLGFRSYSSHAPTPNMDYDAAKHPVNGGSGPEFSSRQVFDDTSAAVGAKPKTRKLSHKMKAKGNVAGGQTTGTLTFSRAENLNTDLKSDVYAGTLTYTRILSPRSRLVARINGLRQKADDPLIDLPTFREGRTGPQFDFDYTRYSSLDRTEGKGSLEYITRLNARTNLALLAAYQRTERDNYPEKNAGTTTSKFTGQAKFRYRANARLSGNFSYRFEKTSDPFVSGRGLFEARGRETLEPLAPNFAFIFYFQREDLRYQSVTTLPTDDHQMQFGATFTPNAKTSLQLGLKGRFDKNGDLDSLDVKHMSLQPTLGLTLTPNPKWSLAAGFDYTYAESRIPITMPLFDG